MPRRERFVVLALTALLVASLLRLLLPNVVEFPQTLGSTVYAEGSVGAPRLLNPLFSDFNEIDRDINRLIFSGLLKYDPTQLNFVPDLAESIQRSNDNLAYLVVLKNGAIWHDSEPVKADDIIFTFQKVIQDPGFKNSILQSAFQDVTIQKVDERTVSFTLKQPNSYFPSYLTVGLLPAHRLGEAPIADLEKNSFNKKPIGTGPYQLTNAITPGSGNSILLRRFEKYHGEKQSFDYVRFSFFPNYEKLIAEKNKINVIGKILSGSWPAESEGDRFVSTAYHLSEYMGLFFNLERPNLEKKKIRQALIKSVDKKELAKLIGSVQAIDTIGFRTQPDEWIHQFDAQAAETALKDLGYRKGDDGFMKNGQGETLEIGLLTEQYAQNSALEQRIAVLADYIKNSWQSAGIKVSLERLTSQNFNQKIKNREYDVLLAGHRLGYNTDAFSFWHSSQANENGLNFSQLKSFRADSLLEDLRATFDASRKRKKLLELEKLIADETAALILFTPEYKMVVEKRIIGLQAENLVFGSDRFANFSQVKRIK